MSISVRAIQSDELNDARNLLLQNGWQHRIKSAEWFDQLVRNSTSALVAVDGHRIIGFVRAISDNMSNGYTSMLVVDESYRRQGIARALIEKLIRLSSPEVTWVLRASRESAVEFFAANGFDQSSDAMELKRLKS